MPILSRCGYAHAPDRPLLLLRNKRFYTTLRSCSNLSSFFASLSGSQTKGKRRLHRDPTAPTESQSGFKLKKHQEENGGCINPPTADAESQSGFKTPSLQSAAQRIKKQKNMPAQRLSERSMHPVFADHESAMRVCSAALHHLPMRSATGLPFSTSTL